MWWQDEGIVLTLRPHGERQACASLLTKEHGRHVGMLTLSTKNKTQFQPGVSVQAKWQARLEEHMGTYTLEAKSSPLAYVLQKPLALKAMQSAISLLEILLPERTPHEDVYEAFQHLIHAFKEGPCAWMYAYAFFEKTLLYTGGITMDLQRCAATGTTHNLYYLSPKTARAVSREAGDPYAHLLLKLPLFLTFEPSCVTEEHMTLFYESLTVMTTLLERFLLHVHHVKMPESRHRFLGALGDHSTTTTWKRIA